MKKNARKGLSTLICCVVLLLACSTAAFAAVTETAETLDISNYLNGQSANNVMSDLEALPTALTDGTSVQWQVLDSATLAASSAVTTEGEVTRPAYGEADAAVILRATLTKGSTVSTRDFYLIVTAMGAEDARTMITRNADFEAEAPGDVYTAPDGWLKSMKWADGPTMLETSYANIVTDTVYSGKQALRLTSGGQRNIKNKTAVEDILNSVQNSAVTTAREGFTYTLDVMAYSDSDATESFVALKFWDNEGLEITKPYTATYTSTSGCGAWKNLHISAVAPAGTVMVTAELDAGAADGYVTYFDDVRLREWPIVANGDFDLGTTGWTTTGTVSNGELVLTSGQTAVSVVRGADRGVAYYLSLEATGGTAALRFVNANGGTLKTYSKTMTSGLNAFYAYAPANTAGVQVVLTGAMTADNVKITRSAIGTAVADGDFEFSANAGMGSPWTLSGATIASNTGLTGDAGVTLTSYVSGTAKSNFIPVEDGKNYVFSADVKGSSGKMEIVSYNIYNGGTSKSTVSVSSKDSGWNTISYTFDPMEELSDSRDPERSYVQIVLSGYKNVVFDNVKVYSTSKNVSNASMENTKITPYGTFPYNWAGYGSAATYVANQEGQCTEGVKSLAVELFGLGEGGIRSSMIEGVESGKKYEATINAKGSGASLNIEFWSESFSKLSTKSVTIDSEDWEKYSVTGTAPAGAAYASLSVGGNGVGLVYADEATLYPVVRSIGNNVQLFLDDWLIDKSENVNRTLYEGKKEHKMSPVGGYPSIEWDEKEQVFKMWYQAAYMMQYRTSKDGINWSTPVQGRDKGTGEPIYGGYVHIDDSEPDPNKRYKAIIYNHIQSRVDGRYEYHTSADGIYWTKEVDASGNTIGVAGQDVLTMVYDPFNSKYIMTYKNSVISPYNVQTKRAHNIAVSDDLINWSTGVRMYTVGTPMDTVEEDVFRTDGYGNGMYALGDSYVGLNWRTLLNEAESFGGVLDSNMLFSRDLTEDWQRLRDKDGSAFLAIPGGGPGTADSGQIYTAAAPIQVGDETWWYYYAESGEHGYTDVPNKYGGYAAYAVWRKNGFGSLDFGTNGTMTTQQFILTSESLRLNAEGTLNVALLDESGQVLATTVFSGDSVDEELEWSTSVASSLGQPVSLRFTGSNAKLYSLQQSSSITLLPAQNGIATLDATSVAAGSKLTVEVTPNEGYVFERLVVNGRDVFANTFAVPNGGDVTVRAVFVPEFNRFYEDMEDYTAGTELPMGTGESFTKRSESKGEHSAQIVTEGGNQVLKLSATDNSTTDYNRVWLTTNESFSGQYIVQAKIKAGADSMLSSIRLPGLQVPRYNVKTSEYTVGDYELRFKDGEIWVHLDRVTDANAWTGGNAKETADSTSHLGLYTDGTQDGTRVGFVKDTWYTVKIYVNTGAGTVTTELWNSDGTTKLGERALTGVSIKSTAITLDHFATNTASGKTSAAYFDELAVIQDDVPTYTVTVIQSDNGTVSVDKRSDKEGRTITVTAEPDAGYECEKIFVNGVTLKGNSFILTQDVEVSALFWPEGTQFYENFEDYTAGEDYDYDGVDASFIENNITGNAAFQIVNESGTQALKVSATGGTGTTRTWLQTLQRFSGSYMIETRMKANDLGSISNIRISGIRLPNYAGSTVDYELRFKNTGDVILALNKVSALNVMGTEKAGSIGELYLYKNGVKVTADQTPANTWYTVKIYVNADAGTVITELWNSDGTAKLGERTLKGATVNPDHVIGIETQSKDGATRTTYTDYLMVKDSPDYTVSAGECTNGAVAVSAAKGKYGTEITVTATPADGYALGTVYVNGNPINGNTFTLTGDTTVTAAFVSASILWYENFDSYTVNSAYDYTATGATIVQSNVKGTTGFQIVNEDGAQALKVSATGGTGSTRTWLQTAQKFSGSYVIESRMKANELGSISNIRIGGIRVPSSSKGTVDYELRLKADGSVVLAVAGLTTANAVGTENPSSASEWYLYDEGTKLTADQTPANTWYTVKIYVNTDAGTVITELWNGDGTAKLGGRTLKEVTFQTNYTIGMETQSTAGATRVTYMDYIVVRENPDYTVTAGECENGTVVVSAAKAKHGTEVTVTATPATGYVLNAIYVNGETISGNTFTLTGDTIVTADFQSVLYTVSAGSCVNGSVEMNKTVAERGTEIMVTATSTKAGYVAKTIYVNGEALPEGVTSFVLTGDTIITADFWPEGSKWHEDFDSYTVNSTYDYTAAGATIVQSNVKGTTEFKIVNEDGAQALKVSATGDTGSTRTWLQTAQKFSGSYVIESRMKANELGGISNIRIGGIRVPSSSKGTVDYELRLKADGSVLLAVAGLTTANAVGTENPSSASEWYLYDEGTKLTADQTPANTWYTVKIYVNTDAGTVITELWNGDGTAKLGGRTLKEVTFQTNYTIGMETQSTADVTRVTYMDYITVKDYECPHANKVALGEAKAATCTDTGLTAGEKCSDCGEPLTEQKVIPATGHSYKSVVTAPTCTVAGYTTYTCSACGDTYKAGEVAATGHSYKSVVTAPTCTVAGYTTYTCSVCGDTYKADEVAATGHSYKSVVTAPTCTVAGYTTYTCSACGDSYTGDEVSALDHDWDEGKVTTPPTTETEGVKTFTCQREGCGVTKTEPVDKEENETPVEPELPTGTVSILSKALALDDKIFIKVFVGVDGFEGLDRDYLAANGGLLVWRTMPEEAVYGTADEVLSGEGMVYEASKTRWMLSTGGLAPKEYGDTLYILPYIRVAEDEYVYGTEILEYGVRIYCEGRFEKSTDTKLKNMCGAMLHYGAAAQKYFKYNTENPANAGILANATWSALYPNTFNESLLNDVVETISGPLTNSDKFGKVNKALMLDELTYIRYYLKNFNGTTTNKVDMLFWENVNGELTEANATVIPMEIYNDGRYYAESRGVVAKEFGATFVVCFRVTDEEGTHYSEYVPYGIENYTKSRLTSSSDENLKDMMKCMVSYGDYAVKYFAK